MRKRTVVIVGGGTAGLTIANQLQNHFDVKVVEKSRYRAYPPIYQIPLMIGLLYRRKTLKYISKMEVRLGNGRNIPFFESNVLGGASAINGCVHMIGAKSAWNDILSDFGASYQTLIDSYTRLYTTQTNQTGKINLTLAAQNLIDKAFIKALNNKGIPCGDMNFSDQECCGPIYDTVRRIARTSVLSLIQRKNFQIFLYESAQSLITANGDRITGITTNKRTIFADYVILAGGVIGTCKLLLSQPENTKIHHKVRLHRVGNDIQDHINLRVNVITKSPIGSLNEISQSFLKKLALLVDHFLGKPTLMLGTGATSGVHLDLNDDGVVDTRIQVVQFTETGRHGSDGKYFGNDSGFSLSITPIHPASRGHISLVAGEAVVSPGFLSDREDINLLKLALRYCLNILRSEPLADHIQEIVSEDLITHNPEKYIQENIYSGHHLIGGTHHAIDSDFRFRGVEGLYVCDASIFKRYAASNIHSSVVLISDIFAKRLLARNQHAPK